MESLHRGLFMFYQQLFSPMFIALVVWHINPYDVIESSAKKIVIMPMYSWRLIISNPSYFSYTIHFWLFVSIIFIRTLFLFSIKPHHIPNKFVDMPALPSAAVLFDCLHATPPVDSHWLHTLQGAVGIKLQRSGVKAHLINLQLHLLYKFALETLFVGKNLQLIPCLRHKAVKWRHNDKLPVISSYFAVTSQTLPLLLQT